MLVTKKKFDKVVKNLEEAQKDIEALNSKFLELNKCLSNILVEVEDLKKVVNENIPTANMESSDLSYEELFEEMITGKTKTQRRNEGSNV